jgi:uncharacterized protein (TIGR02611 family)
LSESQFRSVLVWVGRSGKRILVSVVGAALLVGGLVMLVLPGPGLLAVAAGLAVLATEYAWARRALDETRRRAGGAARRFRRERRGPDADR